MLNKRDANISFLDKKLRIEDRSNDFIHITL